MKFFVSFAAALFTAAALFAQTPEEIIAKMDQQVDRFEAEGYSMVMDMKLPLLGSYSTKVTSFGKKTRMDAEVKGNKIINWNDGVTSWDYDTSANEITITNAKPSEDANGEGNVKMLDGVTEGYDVRLTKETDEAWYFVCKKSKSNTKKDDPKKMDLVVSKATYLPISHSVSEKGVTITLRDFAIGADDAYITFNPADYPNVKIIDKR